MIRVLIETSLPAATLETLAEALRAGAERPPWTVDVRPTSPGPGCGGAAGGGDACWRPCEISLVAEEEARAAFAAFLPRVRDAVCAAARRGGLEILKLPAAVQLGDEFYRLRDLLELAVLLARE